MRHVLILTTLLLTISFIPLASAAPNDYQDDCIGRSQSSGDQKGCYGVYRNDEGAIECIGNYWTWGDGKESCTLI